MYTNNSNKKKILFVIKTLEFGGGAEKVLMTVADKLSTYHDTSILTFRETNREYSTQVSRLNLGEKNTSRNFLVNFLKCFSRARKIKNISQDNKIDIVIAAMKEANFPSLLSSLIFFNRARIVIWIHNDPQIEYGFFSKLVAKILYPFASNMVFLTKESSLFFKNDLKTIIIPNPIPIDEIKRLTSEQIDNPFEKAILESGNILMNVGRLVPQKNHLLLLEIFHKVSELDPNTKLIILGQGPLKKDIEKKIKQLNLEDRVFLFGLKNNIFKYLIHAKLFILTSSFEGFSNVILEAMALGIPVISNDCSAGPSEILGNTAKHLHTEDKFLLDQFGIRIPSDNFQEFVKAIIFMLTHADIMKKYEDLSRTRAKDFDIEKIIPQWRALIDLI